MPTFDEVAKFVRDQTGCGSQIHEATSLQFDIGVYGDDMDDLLIAYEKQFDVELTGYVWYFHTGEEGFPNIGGLFFPPPNERVQQIPITIGMLHDFAQRGRWDVKYPEYKPPGFRFDRLINRIVAFGLLALIFTSAYFACVGE